LDVAVPIGRTHHSHVVALAGVAIDRAGIRVVVAAAVAHAWACAAEGVRAGHAHHRFAVAIAVAGITIAGIPITGITITGITITVAIAITVAITVAITGITITITVTRIAIAITVAGALGGVVEGIFGALCRVTTHARLSCVCPELRVRFFAGQGAGARRQQQ
jgi:hypothetical protein